MSLAWLAKASVLVLSLVALFWLLSQTAHVLLLFFGAITVAVVLRAASDLVHKLTRLPSGWSLGVAIVMVASILVLLVLLLGAQLVSEFSGLSQNLPSAINAFGQRFGMEDLWQQLSRLDQIGWMSNLMGYVPQLLGALSAIILILVGGVFLAVAPKLYINGALNLVPKPRRDTMGSAFTHAGQALRLWLIGKIISMLVIGVATTLGLLALGMPSAFALGAIAGVLEYIPFIGPIVSFFPAALVALQQDGGMIWWVLGLYLLVQQLESNVLVPLIQKRTVELPPALGLFAIVALGLVFGPLGLIFGVPLTVVLMVLVKELYMRKALGDDVDVPGER